MTQITLDAATAAKLAALPGAVQLCDESGKVLGWYEPERRKPTLQELLDSCPHSDEELERRRRQGGGRPLKDILNDLGAA